MQHALITVFMMFAVGISPYGMSVAEAFFTPHPIENYERGIQKLTTYQGDTRNLEEAQNIFIQIIEKHPSSPFGYLGMSKLKILEGYRYDQHYNIKIIMDEAMPMALKAMRTGPTIDFVQDHYDHFEKILQNNDKNQERVRELLFLYPERSETYSTLADYLCDQGDFEKALEYYKVALRFSTDDEAKLKVLQRIAQIYSQELPDATLAIEYWEAALIIKNNLAAAWESLGIAYLKLQRYDLGLENFKKAFAVFHTPQLSARIWETKGLLYQEQGEMDSAIEAIRRAIDENSQNTSLHKQLGKLYYSKNDFKSAYQYFQIAISVGSKDPDVFYFAGRCAHALGEEATATNYYSQYLQLKNEGQEAEWIRQNIPELSHL